MRLPNILLLLLVIATGCSNSKPGSGENTETTSVPSNTDQPEEIKLNPLETERLRVELFHYVRESEAYVTSPLNYIQHESFTLHDKGFKYVAHYSPAKDDPNDESDDLVVTGDIDTIWIEATYRIALGSKRPEGGVRDVTLIYSGYKSTAEWTTYFHYVYADGGSYGGGQVEEHEAINNTSTISEKTVTLSIEEPRIYSREDQYLKLRITTISEKDLSGYSKDELGYLRNEVFARHGHTFKTPKMIAYFNTKDWYKAHVDDATPYLNDIEKKNVEFIKGKEQG